MMHEGKTPLPAAQTPIPWRTSDFASILDLEDWLSSQRLSRPHPEPEPFQAGVYAHPGYEAVQCAISGQPTIRAVGNRYPRRCGRATCGS